MDRFSEPPHRRKIIMDYVENIRFKAKKMSKSLEEKSVSLKPPGS